MVELKRIARKRVPDELAVIDADRCTGCAACVEVCPVDCIVKIDRHPEGAGLGGWCEIDWDRCIGCRLCIRVPGKKSDPYELRVCPCSAIEMVSVQRLPEAVEGLGGAPAYLDAHRERLLALAQRQAQAAREG